MGLRIIGLGDSTTAGTPGFLSPLEAPPKGKGDPESQYAYWIMQTHPEWTVLNRGINGQRSDEILARFEQDVELDRPHCVIILAGVNDVYQSVPVEAVKHNLFAIYQKALISQISPLATTILPYNTASASEIKAIRGLNFWISETATNLGILFSDTNLAVRDPGDPNRLASSPEGLHPDVSGYRKMGEALSKAIEQGLKSGLIRPPQNSS